MVELSSQSIEVLVKIYIGQNIRNEGILQSEVIEKDHVLQLLSEGVILENHWYLNQFKTTEKGSEIAQAIVKKRIKEKSEQLRSKLGDIPRRVLNFFVRRYVSKNLTFRSSKPSYAYSWEDLVLTDNRIWILWDKFFMALVSLGLCVKTYDYASTRGGELRDVYYVISPEIREFIGTIFLNTDFTPDQENIVRLYPVLRKLGKIIGNSDLDLVRQQSYELLKASLVSEEQLAGIIDAMNQIKITSEYRGLLSVNKLFEISDPSRFEVYLYKNLLEPAVRILLQEKEQIQAFTSDRKIQSFEEEMSQFYITVSSFERQLRDFVKTLLGKSWEKRIENDFPGIITKWRERAQIDRDLGIEPEKDLINYADLDDYTNIIKRHDRLFTDGEAELEDVRVKLKDWYRYGRNPVMHSRTCDKLKIATTESAIKFLQAWMSRRRHIS